MRMSPEDRAAYADARIAAVKADLNSTPIENLLGRRSRPRCGDFAKYLRTDRANARMNAKRMIRRMRKSDPVPPARPRRYR